MDLIHTVAELRRRREREHPIVLVPTMGNLHAGHIALVEKAREHGRCVVVSIFVNRLQFEPGGDFDRYPRTLEPDCEKLARAKCDVVFAPDEREMYPAPQEIVQLFQDIQNAFLRFQRIGDIVETVFYSVRKHIEALCQLWKFSQQRLTMAGLHYQDQVVLRKQSPAHDLGRML